jgi:hypothetical protein
MPLPRGSVVALHGVRERPVQSRTSAIRFAPS